MATVKMKRTVKELGGNGGNLSQAMIKAGYKKRIRMKTEKLTQSKSFQELMEKELPEGDLLKVHKRGLEAFKVIFSPEGEMLQIHDFPSQHKFMETGYKLRGKLNNDEPKATTNIFIHNLTVEQRQRIARRILRSTAGDAALVDGVHGGNEPELPSELAS